MKLSSYGKLANNSIYGSVKCQISYSYNEGTNKEHTVATETNCGIGAHHYEITP